jgi:orotate phosphoribosyltransferase
VSRSMSTNHGSVASVDLDRRLSLPDERRQILDAVLAALRADAPDMLVSSGTEALALTSLAAAELSLPMAYLRPRPKEHGRQQRVEGELRGSHLALLAVEPTAEIIQDNLELVAERGANLGRVLAIGSGPPGTPVPVTVLSLHASATAPSAAAATPKPSPRASTVSAEQIARILLDVGAVIIRHEPFRYASGILSPIYTDCRLLISHPEQWRQVLDSLEARLRDGNFDAIDGVATSGIPHASVLAHRLDKPLAYVSDGQLLGAVRKGERAVIVEDLVTTGKSVLEAAAGLREHGIQTDRCVAIFTYSREQPSLETAGIRFEPLSDLATLLQVGVAHAYFAETERDAVLDWRRDPQDWTARHEAP